MSNCSCNRCLNCSTGDVRTLANRGSPSHLNRFFPRDIINSGGGLVPNLVMKFQWSNPRFGVFKVLLANYQLKLILCEQNFEDSLTVLMHAIDSTRWPSKNRTFSSEQTSIRLNLLHFYLSQWSYCAARCWRSLQERTEWYHELHLNDVKLAKFSWVNCTWSECAALDSELTVHLFRVLLLDFISLLLWLSASRDPVRGVGPFRRSLNPSCNAWQLKWSMGRF